MRLLRSLGWTVTICVGILIIAAYPPTFILAVVGLIWWVIYGEMEP